MPRVVALVPDMIDRSKIAAAAGAAGYDLVAVRSAGDVAHSLDATTELVILDLSRPGALEVLAATGDTATVGFASHVDGDLMRRARAAGCDVVLARSAFFTRLAGLFEGTARP